MAIVVFFLPSLGLYSILNHWKAELLFDRLTFGPFERLKLEPPLYSFYTGLSLGHTFMAFLALTALHLISISVVKIIKVEKKKKEDWFKIMVHIFENINIPSPYKDWDSENLTVAEFHERLKEVNFEMALTFRVNFIFNILMFCPFWWTGTFTSFSQARSIEF